MYGWNGSILVVDLTNRKTRIEDYNAQAARDFIGGRGWAVEYMHRTMNPAVDPLSPDNPLIFATGPLTATAAPTGNRYMVVTKSPLTGALSCSNAGGRFPTELKRTGFDMVVFEGRADRPVYAWINDDRVEIRPAVELWGKTVSQTEEALLRATHNRARVASIGPAGECLARIAAIMNDRGRTAARSGVGAVMGSKNLKALVVRGTREPALADAAAMDELCRALQNEVGGDVKKGSSLRTYGTAYVPPVTNEMGILPTRNFTTGRFEGVDGISGHVLTEKYLIRPKPCFRCPIGCGRETRVDEPEYAGQGEGPEYETISALGSACGIGDLAAITKANYLCNELGLDTISAGMTIAAAMEMSEKGLIPEDETGGPLRFGDAGAMIKLIEQAGYRRGFGDLVAEGSYRMAARYGHPEYSMTARKQEFPGYDPRGAQGMGLLYATSNKGASHMAGDVAYTEVFGVPVKTDPLAVDGKAALVKRWQDAFAIIDAAGMCVFLSVRYLFGPDAMISPARLTELLNRATGAGYTPETLLEAGERVFNLERLLLLGAGFTAADDTLPRRILEEPLPAGPAQGRVSALPEMLPEYYRERGWDEQGVPTAETLARLGLR